MDRYLISTVDPIYVKERHWSLRYLILLITKQINLIIEILELTKKNI